MIQFFQTIMGKAFYEGHVPKIANALVKIADQLEQINKHLKAQSDQPIKLENKPCIDCGLYACRCKLGDKESEC